jgi:predicted DsbA family dithiol-disulfide isomerase
MKVEIYSDIVCPWCYVGERRFARALADFPEADQVEVMFRPYQLDPGAPVEAVPHDEYLAKRYGRSVAGMHGRVDAAGEGEGITFEWERALSANTLTAHRLLQLAEHEYGGVVQRALLERLFDMHFTRGGNIADIEQLAEEAAAVGIDRGRAKAYLGSDEGLSDLQANLETARELGISAVPTLVFNGEWAIQGAHPVVCFTKALTRGLEQSAGR